jgi:acetyl esterase/lipase
LLDHVHVDPARIVIGGDSAGGGLAIALIQAIVATGLPTPAAAFAMSPWADLACTAPSMQTRAEADLIADSTFLLSAAAAYLGPTDPMTPLASPLWGDLSTLPPLLLQVGDHEVLLDDSVRLASRAREAGVDVTLHVFDEMQHVFQMNVGRMPEADQAIDEIVAFVRDRLQVGIDRSVG